MRKEVKRSLLFWPTTASVTITALAWLMCSYEHRGAKIHRPAVASVPPKAVVLDLNVSSISSGIELSARNDHGRRAMKLPDRVARLFGDDGVLQAPRLDEQRELAGLVMAHDEASSEEMPELVGPVRPDGFDAGVAEMDVTPIPSLLPRSTRVLAKVVLDPVLPLDLDLGPATDLPDPVTPSLVVPTPVVQPAYPPESSIVDVPVVEEQAKKPAAQARPVNDANLAGWPVTRRLDDQLDALAALADKRESATAVSEWSEAIAQQLVALRALPRLGDPRAGAMIDQLSELSAEGALQAERLEQDRPLQIAWLCTSYAIARRVAVWRPVWEVARVDASQSAVAVAPNRSSEPIDLALDAVRDELEITGDQTGWTRYLLLDEIQRTSHARASMDAIDLEAGTVVAQRFLSRLDWHGLSAEQRQWLSEQESIQSLSSIVRPWAQDAVDYANLLSQIERQESDAIDMTSIDIAGAVQTLRFAENDNAVAVADAINTHYRNANVRIALSQPMLQRVLPTVDPRSVPVRMQLFGSDVRGLSQIDSDLQVELKPSPDRWSLNLNAAGNVKTRSTGVSGPVAVRTSSKSRYVATTPIEINKRNYVLGDVKVDVSGRTNLTGIQSDYDGWPLIGPLVRSMAAGRYETLAPRTDRVAKQRIRSEVVAEIDQQLDEQMGAATNQLGQLVLGPLGKLRLDPQVTDMQTTQQRLLARYRLAGDWQLGAFTARPRAPRTSLMSVQVHQSALNNTLEQLVPRDGSLTISEMIQNCVATFGQKQISIPDDIPEDVTVQFAPTRPITVEIEEGRLWVTLRIVRLNRRDQPGLKRFIVRAAYRPEMNGLQASLVRDGHLRISGPGMSMRQRLPIRAIFNKVLSPNRALNLTLPQLIDHPAAQGLAVSQLELRSGWIGIAISESDAPRIALQRVKY